jgi:hypothetical protein
MVKVEYVSFQVMTTRLFRWRNAAMIRFRPHKNASECKIDQIMEQPGVMMEQ